MSENKQIATNKTPILDSLGSDLIKKVKDGLLSPVIGREQEIKRLIQILNRKTKRNSILCAHEGVGKTALVHGLAQKIVNKDVPNNLLNKRIIEIDISTLIAGTKFRGELEARIKSLIAEVQQNPDIIIFIDEIHNLIGGGSSTGSMDVSNQFKTALSSNSMQLIGATTFDEYRLIEKEKAFNRRFQKISIDEPSIDDTFTILKQIKNDFENYHNVYYSDEILNQIVKLCNRHLKNKHFPDKAIDVLDEVGSSVNTEKLISLEKEDFFPKEIIKKEKELNKIIENKKNALKNIKNEDYTEVVKYRNLEKLIIDEIENLKNGIFIPSKKNPHKIIENDVNKVVSSMANIPLTKLSLSENEKLINLESELNKLIIGQEKAVERISKSIKRHRLGIKKINSSQTILFLGKSSTGKSHTAKILAKLLFDDENSLIEIAMNEFKEKISISRLIGAAPGYIGYEESGELTKKIKNKPYCIVLLDEIEEAHPDVLSLFLQAFRDGFINDSQGNRIDCRNILWILTSNIGTEHLKNFGTGIGFTNINNNNNSEAIEDVLMKQLEKTLQTKILNRINDVVVFNSLTEQNLFDIISLYIEDLNLRLSELSLSLQINDDVKKLIIKESDTDKYGASSLERNISKLIEDPLTDLVLSGIDKNSIINVIVANDKIEFELNATI